MTVLTPKLGIADRQNYIKKIDILSDQKKLIRVNLKDDTLNFVDYQENHVDKVLKKLVESKSMTKKNRKC